MAKDAEQLQRIMANLKCTEEEAAEIMAYDKAVHKVAQSYARTGTRKPTVYKFDKKERKPNEPKRDLINLLAGTLTQSAEGVEITNPERQIDFTFNGTKYRIVLSAPRK